MSTINFKAKLSKIGSQTIIVLPKNVSAKLPSRGMVMAALSINGSNFQAALEPDGKKSHWFIVNKAMLKAAKADIGETITIAIEPVIQWPEPETPSDLKKALAADSKANKTWISVTPIAHWDWIRWIRSTKVPETRMKHINVACSKLRAGTRRPCCFNRSTCTDPAVSNNGILLEPA
jgi:hypothetical protein